MPAGVAGVAMLPYRDENNSTIAYAPAQSTNPNSAGYDSDFEPLIASPAQEALDDDTLQRFTATGRPVPAFKSSGLVNLGGHMYTAPQLLPKRYTDDSIIPAIVTNVIPKEKQEDGNGEKKKGFLRRLSKGKEEFKSGEGILKVVYMPRRDYLKNFARGSDGEYIGTEPYRRWSEEELEEQFKQYIPEKKPEKKSWNSYRPPL